MTDERFNEIISGPLWHPISPLMVTRIAMALRAVLLATGNAGDAALEAYAAARDRKDAENDRYFFG